MKNFIKISFKRLIAFSLFTSLVLGQFITKNIMTVNASTTQQNQYYVKLNNSNINLTLPILNIQGRLMYPFRECLETMGANVDWDSTTQTAKGTYNNKMVEFIINSGEYKINGVKQEMETGVKTFIQNDRTYIPLRYAAEALGFTVTWDSATNTALINSQSSVYVTEAPAPIATQTLNITLRESALTVSH